MTGFRRIVFGLILSVSVLHASDNTIFLWPDKSPENPIKHEQKEFVENRTVDQNELGLNRSYSFVSQPTMTVHLADADKNTGVAVVLFPGGGYTRVVIDKEGNDIARILNENGISAFVVKYSTFPQNFRQLGKNELDQVQQIVLEDAQRAIRIVRGRAKEWNVNPGKVGAMGFSAGGNLTYRLATNYDSGLSGGDEISSQNCKVNFACPMYPAIRDGVADVNAQTPPMFIVVANDDTTTPADDSIALVSALRKNNVTAELHIFTKGGHGFGKGVKGGAVTQWPGLFIEWLKEMKFIEN